MIYDYHPERQGLKLRLGALVLLIIVMATVVIFSLTFALGSLLFSRFLSETWERFADYALLAVVSFLLIMLLNVYICPYKAKMRLFLPGSLITLAAWIAAIVGFSIYLKISNVTRLYGALSALIVFLLWLYLLMIGFIVGVILNSEIIAKRQIKKVKRRILQS